MWEFIIENLAAITAIASLIVALVRFIYKSVKERNWKQVVKLVMKLMAEAEKKFDTGAERKEWVLVMIKASADTINYDIDMAEVEELIDDLCKMSKDVNVKEINIVE